MVNLDRGEGLQAHLIATPGPHEQTQNKIKQNWHVFNATHFQTHEIKKYECVIIVREFLALFTYEINISSVQYWRETFHLFRMFKVIQVINSKDSSYESSHWRETLSLFCMFYVFQIIKRKVKAYESSHFRETLQLF